MTKTEATWTKETVRVAGVAVPVLKGGAGDPLVILHRDIGNPPGVPFYDRLTPHFTVYVPSHPGYDGAERPDWLRNARDIAVIYQWLIAELNLARVSLVGLGLGGWIAAEMAAMSPTAFHRLALIGAMGIRPAAGEILDQALVSYVDYVRAGFADPGGFERLYGAEPPVSQLEQWDLNREMSFRIAWKPYMYNPSLPHLLGGVRAPSLVVWGEKDRVVPRECGERYAKALAHARLEIIAGAGHFVEMEHPDRLVKLVTELGAGS